MLDDLALFDAFSPEERARISLFCQTRSLATGERLFEEGEDASAFYAVRSGLLEVYRSRSGVETRVNTVGPGDVVGEMALFDRDNVARTRTASIRALEPTELVVIIEQAVSSFASDEPAILGRIRALISARKAL